MQNVAPGVWTRAKRLVFEKWQKEIPLCENMTLIQRIRESLDYDPLTGIFRWKIATGPRASVGHIAGSIGYQGYYCISIFGKNYRAHRLAYAVVYGEFPPNEIDHINGIRHDNRISNIRLSTRIENQKNLKSHRFGKLVGSSWCKRDRKWRATIVLRADGKRKKKSLGYFLTEQEAHEAYLKADLERNSP